MDVPHIVTELRARLGDRFADPAELQGELGRMRMEHHLSPSAWALVERIALAWGRRGTLTPAPTPAIVDGPTGDAGCVPPPVNRRRPALEVVAP